MPFTRGKIIGCIWLICWRNNMFNYFLQKSQFRELHLRGCKCTSPYGDFMWMIRFQVIRGFYCFSISSEMKAENCKLQTDKYTKNVVFFNCNFAFNATKIRIYIGQHPYYINFYA